jgi:hypothetical protein
MLPDKKRTFQPQTKHTCPRCQYTSNTRCNLAAHLERVHKLAKVEARTEAGLEAVPKPANQTSNYYIERAV